MAVNIDAQAAQAAAQGQQMLADYRTKAGDYTNQYNSYVNQANEANQNVKNYTNYMQGEGSAGNQFHGEFGKELGELGYSPEQMTQARGNLNQSQGALSAYSDFANQAASKWGMNAGGFAAANSGALGSLNNNIASNQGVVSSLSDLYKTAQTGATQFTGQVVQGEHETMAGLQDVYTNAANARDSAGSMMNFYDDLAQKQGGLNAQQQQYYAQAKQAYAAANAAMAQAGLYAAQAAQTRQQVGFMNDARNQFGLGAVTGIGSPSSPAAPVKNTPAPSAPSWYSPSNIWSTVTNEGPSNIIKEGIKSRLHL